jgi:hypothetical protein
MSKFSVLIRRYRNSRVVEGIVEYLETVDLPGSVKKSVALAVVKALHTKTGGKWDKQIEQAVAGGIEWALAEIREFAVRIDDRIDAQKPQPTAGDPEPDTNNYMRWYDCTPGAVPPDEFLLDQGFKEDDVIYVDSIETPTKFMVVRAGDAAPVSGAILPLEYGIIGQ